MAHKAKRPAPAKVAPATLSSSAAAAGLPYTGISNPAGSSGAPTETSDLIQAPALDSALAPQPRAAWIEGVNQLPQNLREWGAKAIDRVSSLSTTQKVVGGALVLGGIGWLSLRSKDKASSPADENAWRGDEAQRMRPWGSTGYASVGEPVQPIGGHTQHDSATY